MSNCGIQAVENDSNCAQTRGRILRSVSRSGLLCLLVALAALTARAQVTVSVLTQHNDIARTGQNTSETILNTSNVKSPGFAKRFALTVPGQGQVYAQPLYVPNVTIGGVAHNVLIVATEQDFVYAFDADSNTGANANPLWSANLASTQWGAGSNETPLTSSTTIGCTDLQPLIGITSTPVIDKASQTIYVEAKTNNHMAGTYFHRLHALSLTTGAEVAPGPVLITGQVKGTGEGSTGGVNSMVPFDSLHQMNRVGLLLQNDTLYLAYASHCDISPYHGWLFAYDEATLTQKSLLVTTPNGGLGGFWMGGAGLAADSSGNIYVPTGNGDFDTTHVPATELSDTILKIGTANQLLTVLDYFTPSDQACLQTNDTDLGSGGLLLLPDQTNPPQHLLVQAGKEGMVYVVNRDMFTNSNVHYVGLSTCTSTDPEIQEESPAVGGMWTGPSYWNNNIYFWGTNDVLKSIPITNGLPDFTHISSATVGTGYPSPSTSISSNGTTAGTAIVWGIDATAYSSGRPAILHAFDATNLSSELWNSSKVSTDAAGGAVKFAVPTIANGKVYVGTSTEVDVYGLTGITPQTATPVITPATETSSKPVRVKITDTTSGATIYYTTNNTTPSTSSTVYTGPFAVSSTATVQAVAQASGDTLSGVASATYTIGAAVAPPQITPASGTYTGSVTVTMTDTTSGASIYYTTGSGNPSPGQPGTLLYSSSTPPVFTTTTRFKAIAVLGATQSTVASAAYRITP
jgi:Fn3 associated/Chitobiase/beta-hexosaminidase C-terminal domain